MAKITRLAASDIAGTNKVGFDFEIKSDAGTLTTANANHEIQILPAGGMVFSYDSGDLFEPFEPIVSSRLDLSFFATHDDQLEDIVAMNRAGEKSTYIKVTMWKNASVKQYWYGVLVPEETSYEVTDGRTLVRMKFADGLKMLDSEELTNNTTGELLAGWKTSLDYVNTILRKIPWVDEELSGVDDLIRETPFFELKDWNDSVGYSFAAEGGMLRKTGFMSETYYKDKGKSSDGRVTRYMDTESCLKALTDICVNFGYKLCWNGETFHFFSPLNYTDEMNGQVSHDSIVYQRDQAGSQTGTYDAFEPEWDSDQDTKLMNGAMRVFSNCYKEAIITHTQNIASNLIGPQSGMVIEGEDDYPNIGSDEGAEHIATGYSVDQGAQFVLRVAGTLNLKDNQNYRGSQYFAKMMLKVGNYYLNGAVSMTLKDLDNGAEFPCLDKDLPAAYWTTTPSYLYIPYITGNSYVTPTQDEHLDGEQYVPSQFQHDGDGNYSYDENRLNIAMDYTIVTPELPADSDGIQVQQGLVRFVESGGAIVEDVDSYDADDNYGEDFFSGAPILDYFRQSAFLYEGEQTDDPSYATLNSDQKFTETLDLGEVQFAARLNRSGGSGYISALQEAGGYTFDPNYVIPNDTVSTQPNNLRILVREWYNFGGTGMEGLEGDFMFNPDTTQTFIPWADSVLSSGCILGSFQTADMLINGFSYDLVGSMQISALVIDRDNGVTHVDDDRPVQGTGRPSPPTIDGRTQTGSGGVSQTALDDAKDQSDILSIFLSRNNP